MCFIYVKGTFSIVNISKCGVLYKTLKQPPPIFSLYRTRTIKLSTWFALCKLDYSISGSNIYPGLSHCSEAVNPVSLNNANAKCIQKPLDAAKRADKNKATAGHLV